MEMITMDLAALRHFLEEIAAPVAESILLKKAVGIDSLPGGHEELFALHFSLYHQLYRLKREAGADNWYLHLDPMRIRLVPVPGEGHCHSYLPEQGTFCPNDTEDSPWCAGHAGELAETAGALHFDPMLDFYTNPENISFGRSDLLRRQMRGVMVYAFKKGEIEAALDFFRITNPSRKKVQRRFHELAKEYHPDRNGGDDVLMKRLNHAYQVLCEVYVV